MTIQQHPFGWLRSAGPGLMPGLMVALGLGSASTLPFQAATAEEHHQRPSAQRQSLDDAWWTGPIIAAGAGTLPPGGMLVEPYLYDIIRYASYDSDGDRRSAPRSHHYGSLTYILYGFTERITAGLIPIVGFNDVNTGRDSSGIQLGDVTLQAQYRLSQFHEGASIPTASVVIQQTLPTGKYDRLGSQVNDGLGTGANTTTLAVFSQYYFWMPNGRIVRTRFNVAYSLSDNVDIDDVSVYGTGNGFTGTASPGDGLTINSSWEYSMTREWVFALDLLYQHDASTGLRGTQVNADGSATSVVRDFGSAWRFGLAPAIEYNFNNRIGIIAGARWFAAGRNTSATITPVVAVNMVY